MNEKGKISEMDNAFYLKWNDACLYFTILVALDSKAEVKIHAKPCSLKTSHGERELVDGRVAHEEHVAELTNCRGCWSSDFSRQVGFLETSKRNGKKSPIR